MTPRSEQLADLVERVQGLLDELVSDVEGLAMLEHMAGSAPSREQVEQAKADIDDTRRRILSALSTSAEQVEGWKPIDTALKDRTRRLLLWLPAPGLGEHIELGYWSEAKGSWVNTYGNSYGDAQPDMWAPTPSLTAALSPCLDKEG